MEPAEVSLEGPSAEVGYRPRFAVRAPQSVPRYDARALQSDGATTYLPYIAALGLDHTEGHNQNEVHFPSAAGAAVVKQCASASHRGLEGPLGIPEEETLIGIGAVRAGRFEFGDVPAICSVHRP